MINICKSVADGVLVFFPSYTVLEACLGNWRESNSTSGAPSLWESIVKLKQPVTEPRESNKLQLAIDDYVGKIKATLGELPVTGSGPKGAIFFAVSRGKVSEGLDFADENGRAVVIIGIPFPNTQDARIHLKKQYLNDAKRRLQSSGAPAATHNLAISGDEWYRQSAWRAVNQAVGRVIRHRLDFGAIILADERFTREAEKHLSKWLRPKVKPFDQFGKFQLELSSFFRHLKDSPPSKTIKLPNGTSTSLRSATALPSAVTAVHEANLRGASTKQLFQSIEQGSRKLEIAEAGAGKGKLAESAADGAARKKEAMQERSRLYLSSVRKLFSKAEYLRFQDLMRTYRERKITVEQLMEEHLVLLGTDSRREDLRQNFTVFLPAENRDEWLRTLNSPPEILPFPLINIFSGHAEKVKESQLKAAAEEFSRPVAPPVIPALDIAQRGGAETDENESDVFERPPSRSAAASFRPPASVIPTSSSTISKSYPNRIQMRPIQEKPHSIVVVDDDEMEFESAAAEPRPSVDVGPTGMPAQAGGSWIKSMTRKKNAIYPAGFDDIEISDDALQPPPLKRAKRDFDDEDIIFDSTTLPDSVVSAPGVALAPPHLLSPENSQNSPNDPKLECRICRSSRRKEFLIGPCGHKFCDDCWQKSLAIKLECPLCRQRTRYKQLKTEGDV